MAAQQGQEVPPSVPELGRCSSSPTAWGEVSQEKLATPKENPATICPGAPQLLILNHNHAHRQWQSIAEEFSSLLDKDFVDVVFKVDGGGILAAHRALVAAAWPSMREELRKLKPPPPALRLAGLAWVNSTSVPENEQREGRAAADAAVQAVAASRMGAGSPTDSMSATPGTPDILADETATARETSIINAVQESTNLGALDLTSEAGVLDVSGKDWGTWSIVRAMFCHLYSRPVAIQASELMVLRQAAERLGCWELAKCCDDAAMRRDWQKKYPGNTTAGDSDSTSGQEAQSRLSERSSTSDERIDTALGVTTGVSRMQSDDHKMPGQRTPEKRGNSSTSEEKLDKGAAVPQLYNEARARSFVKNRGEGSFVAETSEDAQGGGGIRHVLSDLKRTMMEASRVISDKSFQSMYDMVTGERGILGEGINGPVRMARHKRTGREVAVKRISCVNLSEQRRQMLLSEVRIFLTVQHRNIIQLHEVYESEADQAVLLVMELCTGKELFERLAERKYYSELDASRVTRQMLDAVAYLHSQNICHRDLKLENWLYENPSPDAKLKLCDFGFGQIVEPSVQLTATLGSLYYVAPEVLEGSYGLPCDMWSMGVIVYMLLSGNPPFDGKTDADVIGKIRSGRFITSGKRWEGISETARHFLHSVLRKDPYERLSASECTQHAWLTMGNSSGKSTNMPKQISDISIDQSVIRDMTKFAQNNAMTRAALGMLASSSTPFCGKEEDVVALEARFKRLDGHNTGKIDAEEFKKALKESLGNASEEAQKVFERIDTTYPANKEQGTSEATEVPQQVPLKPRKREVNYSEFITLTKAKRVANNSAAIREAFRAFDKEGEGFITDNAIRGILGEDFKGDEEMVKAIMDKCDLNGEGLIDYVDFATAFSEELSKKGASQAEPSAAPEPDETKPKDGEASAVASSTTKPEVPVAAKTASPKPAELTVEQKLKSGEAMSPRERQIASSPRLNSKSGSPGIGDRDEASGDEQQDGEGEHWESDGEEQLVSVKETKPGTDQQGEDKEIKKKDQSQAQKSNRYASFALSLAGSAEHDDIAAPGGVNRVVSMPSDVYIIRQLPCFHKEILRPFYSARPVSNVCMGLIRGTSLYAKQSVAAKLATIIHTICGWYFIMPNPKYHKEVNDRKGLLSKETGKFRFVAWWIHPRFVPQLRRWFERMTYEGKDQERQEKKREQVERAQQKKNAEKAKTAENAQPEMPGVKMGADPLSDNDFGPRGSDNEGVKSEQAPSTPKLPKRKSGGDFNQPSPRAKEEPSVVDPGMSMEGKDSTPPRSKDRDDPRPRPLSPTRDTAVKGDAAKLPRQESEREAKDKADKVEAGPQDFFPMGMGNPGDFQFSDVPKPENYLHTYRELHTREHIVMLRQLYEGTSRFLRTLFDENFLASAHISAGFHYPVRTQYATLHMQVRVNSGSVCREDGRGVDIHDLIESLQSDRLRYYRDEEPLRYQVTENIKVSLLASANEYAELHPGVEVVRQTAGMLSYDLGLAQMPTIKDEGEDEEEAEPSPSAPGSAPKKQVDPNQIGEYILNLQVSPDSAYSKYLYRKRAKCAELFGKDPTYLYPLHISVTGFFETTRGKVDQLIALIFELLSEELSEMRGSEPVAVKECLSVAAGYVLQDVEAPCITAMANTLSLRAKELGISIRGKAVNHISLAAGRDSPELRAQIQDHYCENEEIRSGATFELVLSRRYFRSSFDRLELDGPHGFKEVARIPVATPPASTPTPPLPP